MVRLTVLLAALAFVAPTVVAHCVVGVLNKAGVVRALESGANFL